ncbi:GNAT family N-acetyltransferase [Planctomycetota bacterium]|nr:GNAT family N-acetyltransferase [Planctomycetota bacterium]
MPNTNNIIQANIDNLTSLWQAVSAPFNSLHTTPDYQYSLIDDSDWPNRLWLNPTSKLLTPELLAKIKTQLTSSSKPLRFPLFDTPFNPTDEALLESHNFNPQFEQAGMTLQLTQSFTTQTNLNMIRVTTESQANQWADIYPSSFNYFIHPKLLLESKDVDFYLATLNDQPIGTAVLYTQPESKISGFHCLGIIPSARRQGHAEQIMRHLLNISLSQGSKYATLQASPLGLHIYQRLGFQTQYTIKNYVLIND